MVSLTFLVNDGARTRAINTGNENTVSDITVLVFDKNNSLIGSKYVSAVPSTPVDVPVTARSATGCTIYAIANTGSSSYFAGVNTIDKLNTLYTTIASAEALESSGSTAGSTGALMVGKATTDIPNGSSIPLSLYHQCGKFSFTIKPASGVTITGYQLCNVPLSSYITDSHVPALASTVAGPPAGAGSYGNFTAVSGLSQTTDLSKTYYVYENLCGSNGSVAAEAQRNSNYAPTTASYLLVNAKGSGWISTYRVYLGGITNVATPVTDLTNFNVYRNLNYNCTITLGPTGAKTDTRVTYLGQGTRADAVIGTATVGNYLYSDGTTGTSGTPPAGTTVVGIVFSNQLSSAEYSVGYTHGYALALTDASAAGPTWGPSGTDAGLTNVRVFSAYYNDINAGYYGTFIEGYNKSNSSYPAWKIANTYNVDVSGFKNSGWYLPSIGQWWDVCANLGKVDLTSMQTITSESLIIYEGSTATTNVNNAIIAAGGQALTPNYYYWSASEYSPNDAAAVFFGASNVLLGPDGKDYPHGGVRAVLAF
ncbi:MAG: DUF4906 domain-containing protein [Prevotella sp.]|nr:DUF4906 domain-containing protein [Prevotella sp.]MDN5553197.1 DUF4906 domain-containing protein [Prevotella sp.]